MSKTSGISEPRTHFIYDLNGNETSISISGSLYQMAWDGEIRLVSVAIPGGPTDTYSYNGLGLRVGKTDSDGTSPGSPILSDGHALYTPGLSENRGGVSDFYDFDRLGNLWTLDGTSKNQLAYEDFSGFGSVTAIGGSSGSAFKFGGGNGCQTEADTGLVLMGHRYYDSRQGRFISQDPAGEGDNWYAYAGNNPVNKTDPSGLTPMDGPGSSPVGSPGYMDIGGGTMARSEYEQNFESLLKEAESRQDFYVAPPKLGSAFMEISASDTMQIIGDGAVAINAASNNAPPEPWTYPGIPDPLGIPNPVIGVPTYGQNPYNYLVDPLFDLSKNDWHDVFNSEADNGILSMKLGSFILGVNGTGLNPNFVQGVNNPFVSRNPIAYAVGLGAVVGGGISWLLGSAGAYLTR